MKLAATCFLLLFSTVTHADTLVFTAQNSNETLWWAIPQNPTPSYEVPPVDNWFELFNVPVSLDGLTSDHTLLFYPPGAIVAGGAPISTIGLDGLNSEAGGYFLAVSGSIWTGLSNFPTFQLGTYTGDIGGGSGSPITLTIAEDPATSTDIPDPIIESNGTVLDPPPADLFPDPPANTPEAATGLMLLAGLAVLMALPAFVRL